MPFLPAICSLSHGWVTAESCLSHSKQPCLLWHPSSFVSNLLFLKVCFLYHLQQPLGTELWNLHCKQIPGWSSYSLKFRAKWFFRQKPSRKSTQGLLWSVWSLKAKWIPWNYAVQVCVCVKTQWTECCHPQTFLWKFSSILWYFSLERCLLHTPSCHRTAVCSPPLRGLPSEVRTARWGCSLLWFLISRKCQAWDSGALGLAKRSQCSLFRYRAQKYAVVSPRLPGLRPRMQSFSAAPPSRREPPEELLWRGARSRPAETHPKSDFPSGQELRAAGAAPSRQCSSSEWEGVFHRGKNCPSLFRERKTWESMFSKTSEAFPGDSGLSHEPLLTTVSWVGSMMSTCGAAWGPAERVVSAGP